MKWRGRGASWRDRELQLQIILGAIVEYGTVIFLAYKLLQLIDWLLDWFCENVPTLIQAVAIAAGVGLLLTLIIHLFFDDLTDDELDELFFDEYIKRHPEYDDCDDEEKTTEE